MEINAHSDLLIHWTGKDIDSRNLFEAQRNSEYFERLKVILKYGLWMTSPSKQESIEVNGQKFNKPKIARTCFTELKLSVTEDHAKSYGSLGFGVKRYFLFDRLGLPIHYCQFKTENLFFPPYSNFLITPQGSEMITFFKHMCSGRPLNYDLYNESEWRIIFSGDIRKRLVKNNQRKRADLFVDPKSTSDTDIKSFYARLGKYKPEYLIPLDPWLGIIIYPNLKVKKKAVEDKETRDLLKVISNRPTVTGCSERGCMPIELDLGACKQF
jgi:hypothetical protein